MHRVNRGAVYTVASVVVGLALAACSGNEGGEPAPSEPIPATTTASTTGGSGASTGTGNQDHTGGADARTTTPNAAMGQFGAVCTADAECETKACFLGGQGGFCSAHCSADAQCPTPSSGVPHCNPHGYCRY